MAATMSSTSWAARLRAPRRELVVCGVVRQPDRTGAVDPDRIHLPVAVAVGIEDQAGAIGGPELDAMCGILRAEVDAFRCRDQLAGGDVAQKERRVALRPDDDLALAAILVAEVAQARFDDRVTGSERPGPRDLGAELNGRARIDEIEIERDWYARARIGALAPAEAADVRTAAADRSRRFFRYWTLKEAYVKARGDGLLYPLDVFQVSVSPDQPALLIENFREPAEVFRWSMRNVDVGPDIAAALVVERGPARSQRMLRVNAVPVRADGPGDAAADADRIPVAARSAAA